MPEHNRFFLQLSLVHQQLTWRNETCIACLRKGAAVRDNEPIQHCLVPLGASQTEQKLDVSDGTPEF